MWEGLRNSECNAISCYLLSSKLLFLLILFCCTESYKLVLGEHVQEAAKPSWVFGLKSLGSHLWQPSHRTMPPCTPLVASIQYPGLLGSSAAQCCRCGSQSKGHTQPGRRHSCTPQLSGTAGGDSLSGAVFSGWMFPELWDAALLGWIPLCECLLLKEIDLEGGKYGTDNCGHQKKGV